MQTSSAFFQIRLIVIDSFSYLFRTIDESIVNRVQMLHQLCNDLQDLAEAHKCAVSKFLKFAAMLKLNFLFLLIDCDNE